MIIFMHASAEKAAESHRQEVEGVDVDVNDTIETVKVKVSLVFSELDP